jgi:VWFA-related protein
MTPVVFAAQNPAGASPEASFKTGVKLVQVSVIAQDPRGRPVVDLRREEFQVFDNGSPQEIRLFLSETEKSNRTPADPKTPNTFTNQTTSAAGSRSSYSVIAFDTLATEFAYQGGSGTAWAREKALKMLRVLPPDDNIAIYATGHKLQVIREFTTDRESLEQQLRMWKPSVDTPSVATALCLGSAESVASCNRVETLRRATGTDDEIEQVAEHLAGIPGRKNLIWIAGQFPISPAAAQKLKNADTALYPVDAHGSVIGLATENSAFVAPLRALAASTGGVSFYGRDDLDGAILQALEDGRVSYTLGFYPSGDDRAPRIHQLAVRVTRPGVTLRYRTSYQSETPQQVSVNPNADLAQALNRPVDATGIPIRARVTRDVRRDQDRLNLQATLDVESLDLLLNQNLWTGKIEVVARFTTINGSLAGEGFAQTMTLNLRQATYDKAVRDGFSYYNELKIPAKAVQLKLLFANPATGRVGTLTIPLSEIEATTASAK